ncbi:MAG: LysM peptidoglycan-binding domain-containing protein [Anaerolineaceae bacterium]|nr:LysM peptidoglycan-binding domain-containing protein [Anaerolineaceae bacterium]
MKWNKLWPLLVISGIAFCVGLSIVVKLGIERIPSMDEQIPPGSMPIEVRMSHPGNNTYWPLNYAIPIQISAWGAEPITAIELYVNGTLYETQPVENYSASQRYLTQKYWQPGTSGQFILVAMAVNASGGKGISNAVMIEAGPAVGTGSPLTIKEGDTWENISSETGIAVEEIQQINHELNPQTALSPGSQVMIPNSPVPVSNPNIIPGYDPSGATSSDPASDPSIDWAQADNPKWTFFNDLQFLLKASNQPNASEPSAQEQPGDMDEPPQQNPPAASGDTDKLPLAPTISGSFKDCTVTLFTGHHSDTEDGYFIYRSRNGGEFERIVTSPPYKDGNFNDAKIVDPDQYGLVTYYAASFNIYGENPGPPVSFPLNEMNCKGGTFELTTDPKIDENGDLILPINVDTAYLYLQINDSLAERVPEGDRMFLPNSGVNFNLDLYLDSLVDTFQETDYRVHMEVWGWQGTELVYIGALDHNIHRTILTVCSVYGDGGCTNNGLGEWVHEMTIFPNSITPLNEQQYELRWQTSSMSETDRMTLRIAEEFDGPDIKDTNSDILILYYTNTFKEGHVGGNEGTYLLDFGEILYPEGVPKYTNHFEVGENWQDPTFQYDYPMGEPFSIQIRVAPSMEEDGYNDVSNTVYMHHLGSYEPPDMPPLTSQVPSLYDIEILEDTYQPPKYGIYSKWACVIMDYDPTGTFSAGEEICPVPTDSCKVRNDCESESIWSAIVELWDYVVGKVSAVKAALVEEITDKIPFCDDSKACRAAVEAGVDYGITYATGLPPNIPNSDEAIAQAITESIIAELAYVSESESVPLVCNDFCKNLISVKIKGLIAQESNYSKQPGCYEPSDRLYWFAPCFSPPTQVHPVPGSGDFPGYVVVRVTRKDTPESLAATRDVKNMTQLHLTVTGDNYSRVDQYRNTCHYEDNVTFDQLPDPQDPYFDRYKLSGVMENFALYETVLVPIPWLEPGQSIDIPVKLQQIPDRYHKKGCIRYTGSQYLFFKGTSHMVATEYCYSAKSSVAWVPCSEGSSDTWDFVNPIAPGVMPVNEDMVEDVSDDYEGDGSEWLP